LTLRIGRVRFLVVRKLNLLRRLGLPSPFLPPHLLFLSFSFTDLLSLLLFELLFLSVKSLFGLSQPFETIFVLPEVLRELVTAVLWAVLVVFFGVNLGCLVEDVLDFLFKCVASAVRAESGVALDAAAVQGDFSEVSKPGFSTEAENFLEEVFELLSMVFAKVANRAEVWLLIGGKIPKSDVAFKQSIQFTGASNADRIAEDEDFQHKDRVEGRPPAAVLPRFWVEGIESAFGVKVIDGIGDESLQTVFLNPVGDVLREEMLLVLIVFNKIMRHGQILGAVSWCN
jgi:hypothetical protein